MGTIIVTRYGTTLTENEIEYRKALIQDSKSVYCPMTHKPLVSTDGEILYVNGKDHFISNDGLDMIKKIFGEEFVKERIITYD